jgi:hypothetical protein
MISILDEKFNYDAILRAFFGKFSAFLLKYKL